MLENDIMNLRIPDELRAHIEFLRKELINVGQEKGLNSNEAIDISQDLDHYLAICQKCCPKGKRI
jgi:hypothetical protein